MLRFVAMATRRDDRGIAYVESISTDARRNAGIVYTPGHLVDFILDEAGFVPDRDIGGASLLDPACGAGVFLVAAVRRLAARRTHLGRSLRGRGRGEFLEGVASNLYGVDVDPNACALAREAVRETIRQLAPGPLPEGFFEGNVATADFLTSQSVDGLPPIRDGNLAFVVGNPPYVAATRLSSDYKDMLRRQFRSATGRIDLYTLFIERALQLLRRGGRLAVITPDKFLLSETSRGLRRFILDVGAVRTIARFRSHRVFRDAATVPCVSVVEVSGEPMAVRVLSCGEVPDARGHVQILDRTTFPHEHLAAEPWQMQESSLRALARRIQASHRTLETYSLRISAGPATGNDAIYVQPDEILRGVERDLLRPAVRGRDIQTNEIIDPHLSILLPYAFDRGTPQLIDLADYPNAYARLAPHRQALERRHCVRVWSKRWYDLHDQPACDLAIRPKLLVPDVAEHNRFAVDDGKYLPLHSVYYVLPRPGVDLYFLSALLNSVVIEFLIRLSAPVVKDGFSRYRRQFLAGLPVPEVGSNLHRALVAAGRNGDLARSNELAFEIFGLAQRDVTRIVAFCESLRSRREAARP
jgi:hypothetical protein